MLISLYKYILSLRVDCTVFRLRMIYIIIHFILKMNIGALKNKGLVLLLFQKKYMRPPTSHLANAHPQEIVQETYQIKVLYVVAVTEFVVNVVSPY